MANTVAVNCVVNYDASGNITSVFIDGEGYKTGVATAGFPTSPEFKSTSVAFNALVATANTGGKVLTDIAVEHRGKSHKPTGFSK